ncbi:MAG: hypothetical protein ACLPWS_09715 [Rhodomicrobium sp.]
MGSKAPISAEDDKNIYALLQRHGVSDAQLNKFIKALMMELQILARYARLPGVVRHLDAAIKACPAAERD